MEQAILTEAFKAFDALNEETFPATQEGEEALKKFMDNDISDELEVVIDPDAETEEDIKETYVGDVILNCPVCQSKIYKKPEDVTIDEEKDLANVEEDCPYCQTSGGFEIVGQVAEFDASKPTVKVDGEEVEEEDDDEDEEEELEESLGSDLDKYQKWVDYDMKKYGRISDTTNSKIRKAGLEVVKDKYGDYQVIAQSKKGMKESIKRPIRRRRNRLGEDFQNVDVDTDNEHIRVSSEGEKTSVEVEPKKDFEGARRGDEFIEPVDEETRTEIEATSEPEEEDITIEDIDEESFDELGENYLKRTYDNVVSYRTTRGAIKGNKMFLEGIIKFKSGKEKKTTFVFESYSISRKRKVKLLGENVNFTKNKNAFVITGSVRNKKLTVESFNYNYTAKDARTGASKRLYGTVKR